jgi:transcriptional regulator NrdR family protein
MAFTTYEAPDLSFLKVTDPAHKKPLAYSRAKLFSSIYLSFKDIPQKDSDVDAVTSTIEAKILDTKLNPVPTASIARIILETLAHFNTAAFLRYLSFHTHLSTNAELKKIIKQY